MYPPLHVPASGADIEAEIPPGPAGGETANCESAIAAVCPLPLAREKRRDRKMDFPPPLAVAVVDPVLLLFDCCTGTMVFDVEEAPACSVGGNPGLDVPDSVAIDASRDPMPMPEPAVGRFVMRLLPSPTPVPEEGEAAAAAVIFLIKPSSNPPPAALPSALIPVLLLLLFPCVGIKM